MLKSVQWGNAIIVQVNVELFNLMVLWLAPDLKRIPLIQPKKQNYFFIAFRLIMHSSVRATLLHLSIF